MTGTRVMVPKKAKPLALDLCCGAGGFGIALEVAGYRTLGFDSWQPAIDTHLANGLDAKLGDVMTMDWSVWRDRVEVIVGGPPCQPFSTAGDGKGGWDDRDCIPGFIRAVREVQPEWFVMENVRGLTFKKHREYLDRVIADLEAAGYRVEWRVLNAEEYGVPQTRQRLFIIGVQRRTKRMPRWPEPTHTRYRKGKPRRGEGRLPWVNMSDVLGWDDSNTVLWGAGATSGATAGAASRVLGEPAATITGAATAFWQDTTKQSDKRNRTDGRRLTQQEAALLQTFPDDYIFTGNSGTQHQQIGNAVPPLLALAVIEANR